MYKLECNFYKDENLRLDLLKITKNGEKYIIEVSEILKRDENSYKSHKQNDEGLYKTKSAEFNATSLELSKLRAISKTTGNKWVTFTNSDLVFNDELRLRVYNLVKNILEGNFKAKIDSDNMMEKVASKKEKLKLRNLISEELKYIKESIEKMQGE